MFFAPMLHNLLANARGLLGVFAGDPVAPITVTVHSDNAIASDFGRVSFDLQCAIEKVENAKQLELGFS